MVSTRDFRNFRRYGVIFPPQNKDVCLFPERIGGRYCALHRPHNEGFGRPSIWYAESPDLVHWGAHRCLVRPRQNGWEENRIGGGAPCLRTGSGWLQIYHAADAQQTYRLGLLLLDLENPARVLKRSRRPIFEPETDYETRGFFQRVVFTGGAVSFEDGRVLIYYGASDETTCGVETTVAELLDHLES
jgi:predicted GH43/DUF377 family glycosyl hydrolase